ncbi:MAG: hypothetical protein ABL958_07975 [Bdellovibrionia bacterium]
MMKRTFILFVILGISAQSFGFTKVEIYKISSPNTRLREAGQAGLVSRIEGVEKRDVIRMKSRNPTRYANTVEFPNKYINEIQSGLGKIDPAKALAKLHILKAVEKNWSMLRDSAFLDTPTSNWLEAKRLMKMELERIVLVEIPSKTHFRFETPWASALVKKNLKEVRVTIHVASHLDGNKLPDGAESIQIPDDQ